MLPLQILWVYVWRTLLMSFGAHDYCIPCLVLWKRNFKNVGASLKADLSSRSYKLKEKRKLLCLYFFPFSQKFWNWVFHVSQHRCSSGQECVCGLPQLLWATEHWGVSFVYVYWGRCLACTNSHSYEILAKYDWKTYISYKIYRKCHWKLECSLMMGEFSWHLLRSLWRIYKFR